jgi:aspartate carbamoyltransferase catalytic subunit
MVFISPPELRMPSYITGKLAGAGVSHTETGNLEEASGTLDVPYMPRVQRERFFNEEDCIRLKDSYILNKFLIRRK